MKTIIWICLIFTSCLSACAPIYANSAPPPAAPMAAPQIASPQPPPMMAMPPQNVWFINGCPPLPYKQRQWEVINHTSYWLRVRMGGQLVVVKDNQASLPHLPPGQRAFFFVSHYGRTQIEAQGFYPPDYQNPVVKCRWEINVSATGWPRLIELSPLWCWGSQ